MRGSDTYTEGLFTMRRLDDLVPANHRLRRIRVPDKQSPTPKTEVTLGADKGYDAAEFIEELQRLEVTPHVAQNNSGRRSAVPDEIAATEGYEPLSRPASRGRRRLYGDGPSGG